MNSRDTIAYYDFTDMNYASFFLTGFSENQGPCGYRFAVSKKLPSHLRALMTRGKWAHIAFSIGVFRMSLADREFYFCIDARDSCRADPGMGYHLPLLDEVKFYFKVNYNEDVIRTDSLLRAYASRIIPVAPCFPLRPRRLLPLLSKVAAGSVAGRNGRSAISRIKALAQLPTVEDLRRLRNVTKDLDLFFVSAFYPEPRHRIDIEFRYQIMQEIRRRKNLVSVVGFTGEPSRPYAQLKCPRYTLRDYLRNLARAKVALYVRGLHGCLSFKIGQLLALGMPIVGQSISNNRSTLYGNANFSRQFAFDSPKEIVLRAAQLLREPDELRALRQSNARAFDTRLTPQAATADIVALLRSDVLPWVEVSERVPSMCRSGQHSG